MPKPYQSVILIVDDLPEKHLAYRASLADLQQTIVSAHSGEEALQYLLERDVAVILLDVNMPGISGHETAGLIRARRKSRHTPIIFVTAFSDEVQTAEGYKLGAVDYILSPIVPEILQAKVRVFVELDQVRSELAASHASLEQRVSERTAELARTNATLEKEVAQRKMGEDRLMVLVRELSHRVKNLLSVLLSIVTRTLTSSRNIDEARVIVSGRIRALAHAHELLTEARWNGANLTDVVNAELAGFTERVRVAGPEINLTASAVQTFALITHELLTNATKYGSLSKTSGEVDLEWSVGNDDQTNYLDFRWAERNGPAVTCNRTKGFGLSLIEAMGRSLTTTPSIDLRPDGLVCRMKIPLKTITATGLSAESQMALAST